jgi:hypothetical protein
MTGDLGLPAATSSSDAVDGLKARIAKASSDRDAWRLAGREEQFLEAYFMVEALEPQLDTVRRQERA